MNLTKLMNECKNISFKPLSKNAFSFVAENNNVKISGKCKNTILEAKLVSKSGAVLYSVGEDCLKEEYVESRIKDMHKMFEQAALIEIEDKSDLGREENKEDEKELLLDDTDEIISNDVVEEISEDSITTLSQFKDELINLATRASGLLDLFSEDDILNRSMIIGLISGVYDVAQDTADLEEDLSEVEEIDKEEVKECMCIPSKIDYIDLACKGVNQASYALTKVDNYKDVLGMLEDIHSELTTSK